MKGNWFVRLLILTVQRAWALMTGSFEATFYLGERKQAKKILKDAQDNVDDTSSLEFWYSHQYLIEYKSDWLDRWSFPWVTIAKKKGDCEDFMLLSHAIMKKKAKCHQCQLYGRRDGKRTGHAVLLIQEYSGWVLMSNQHRYVWFKTKEEAAMKHYGDDTISYYIY